MFEKLKYLNIVGGIFATEHKLELFSNPKKAFQCVILGGNGSGKTTISRAFEKIKTDLQDLGITRAELIEEDNSTKIDYPETQQRIFVFNEDFVRNNVHINNTGLETIIMFGQQGEIQDEIDTKRQQLDTLNLKIEDLSRKLEELNNPSNPHSYKYCHNKCCELLRGNNNWADRERMIKGYKTNSPVNHSTIEKIVNRRPDQEESFYQDEYRDKWEVYSKI